MFQLSLFDLSPEKKTFCSQDTGSRRQIITSLFNLTNGGQDLKRCILVRPPKFAPKFANKRRRYALPLRRSCTRTLTSSTSNKIETQKTPKSRNLFRFPAANSKKRSNCRSRSPSAFQKIAEPQEFRRIWLRSHETKRLDEEEPPHFSRITLRPKNPLKSPELSCPSIVQTKWEEDNLTEVFSNDTNAKSDGTECNETMKPQLVINEVDEKLIDEIIPQEPGLCSNSMNREKKFRFPKSFGFRVTVSLEKKLVSIGVQTVDSSALEVGEGDSGNCIKCLFLNPPREKRKDISSGEMHQGENFANNTTKSDNSVTQINCSINTLKRNSKDTTTDGQQNDTKFVTKLPNPNPASSAIMDPTFSENHRITCSSGEQSLKSPCQQESHLIDEAQEESIISANYPNSCANEATDSDYDAISRDGATKEQVTKDIENSTSSLNIIHDFLMMLASPFL